MTLISADIDLFYGVIWTKRFNIGCNRLFLTTDDKVDTLS